MIITNPSVPSPMRYLSIATLGLALMTGWSCDRPTEAATSKGTPNPQTAGLIGKVNPATTFTAHVSRINASPAFFKALASVPDNGPIINLNFLRYRPRANATTYNLYGAVAGREIYGVGGKIAHHAGTISGGDAVFEFSDQWDAVALPVYPRRASYLELQRSKDYQEAISDRVAGTYERLLYVLRDGDPLYEGTISIADLHANKASIEVGSGNVFLSELIRFNKPDGRKAYEKYAKAVGPVIAKAGGMVALSVDCEMPIVSEEHWDHYVLIRFPSMDALKKVYQSDEWQKETADRIAGQEASIVFPTKAEALPK